jgi:hypothetical protein
MMCLPTDYWYRYSLFNVPVSVQGFVSAVEDIVVELSVAQTPSSGSNTNHEVQRLLDVGLNLGGFLCEAGRYREAHIVLQAARCLVRQGELLRMELLSRMLHALACYCNFAQASNVFNELYSAGKHEDDVLNFVQVMLLRPAGIRLSDLPDIRPNQYPVHPYLKYLNFK